MKKKILITTGGSGGHVVPATIFNDHLKDEFEVIITSDKRGLKFLNTKKYNIKIIDTPKIENNFFKLLINVIKTFFILIKCYFLLKNEKIDKIISTGGYMSLPICIAAKLLKIDIFLFEPNLVIGRTNSFFLKYCKKIFCYSNRIINFPKKFTNKIEVIKPLIRKEFYSRIIEQNKINNEITILIIGGSQGARLFNFKFRDIIYTLSKKYKINVIQQINNQQNNELKNYYNKNNIKHKLFNFDEDVIDHIQDADICLTRAGASTLSELIFLKTPFIAIPLATAKDNHQFYNAQFYKQLGCCSLIEESNLNQDLLMKELLNMIENKQDYLLKKQNMEKFSYNNKWNIINEKITKILNENRNSKN